MDPVLERAVRGSHQARDELARRFGPDLASYIDRQAGARIRRVASVSDLCQEVFDRVFRSLSLDRVPEGFTADQFRGRLFRNAHWVISSHAKAAKRFLGESTAGTAEAAQRSVDPPRAGSVTEADELRWVRELADRLDPHYGKVIRLRLEGLEFEEVARRLGEKVDTVRKRYLRACDALKRQIEARLRTVDR